MSSIEDIGNSSANLSRSLLIRQHPKFAAIKGLEALLQSPKKKYEDRVETALAAWERLSLSGNSQEILNEFADIIHRDTLQLVLQGEWPSLPPASKTHLVHLVHRCADLFASHSSAPKYRTLTKLLVEEPWGHPSLKRILECETASIDDNEVISFCNSETSSLLVMRLDVLASSKCEDFALKLARIFVRCLKLPGSNLRADCPVQHRNQIIDYYVALLYKFKLYSEMIEEVLKDLSVEDGLELVERHSRLSSADSRLWKQSCKIALLEAHYLVTTAILQQDSVNNPKMKPLIKLWISLHKECKTAHSTLANIIKQMVLATTVSHHIYNLCSILEEELEEDVKPLIIELFIHGLTLDLNDREKIKLETDIENTKIAEISLSDGFLHLAKVLSDNISISRECVLTAFTLNPTEENYTKVANLAAICQEIKSKCQNGDQHEGVVCTKCNSDDESDPTSNIINSVGSSESDVLSHNNVVLMECDSTTPNSQGESSSSCPQEQSIMCPKCGTFCPVSATKTKNSCNSPPTESSAFDLANYDVLSAANNILIPSRLGISQQLCDDLYVILKTSRWQALHWLLDWSVLKSKCAEMVKDPSSRLKVKELKHLKPDFSQQKPQAPLEVNEFYGIEEGYEYMLDAEGLDKPEVEVIAVGSTKTTPSKYRRKSKDSDSDYVPRTQKVKKKKLTKRTVLVDTSESSNELPSDANAFKLNKSSKPKLGSGKKSLKLKASLVPAQHITKGSYVPYNSPLKVPDKLKKSVNQDNYVAKRIYKKASSSAQLDSKVEQMAMLNSERYKGVLDCLHLNRLSRAPLVVSTDSEYSSDCADSPPPASHNSSSGGVPETAQLYDTSNPEEATMPDFPLTSAALATLLVSSRPSAKVIPCTLTTSSSHLQLASNTQTGSQPPRTVVYPYVKQTSQKISTLESLLRFPIQPSSSAPNNVSIEFSNKNWKPSLVTTARPGGTGAKTLQALRNFRPSERESSPQKVNDAPSLSDINLHPKILLPKMPNESSKSDVYISGIKSQIMEKVLNNSSDKGSILKSTECNVLSSIPGMRTLTYIQPRQTNTLVHVVQTSNRGETSSPSQSSNNNQGSITSSQVPKPTSDSSSSAPNAVVTSVVHHTSAPAAVSQPTTNTQQQATPLIVKPTQASSQPPARPQLAAVTSLPSSTIAFASVPSSSGSSAVNTCATVALPIAFPAVATTARQQVIKTPVTTNITKAEQPVNRNASAKNQTFTNVPVSIQNANPLTRIVVASTPPNRQNTPNARRPPPQGLPKFNQAFGKPSYQADTSTPATQIIADSTTVKTTQAAAAAAAAASGSVPARRTYIPTILLAAPVGLVPAVQSNVARKRAFYVAKELPPVSLTAEDMSRLRANSLRFDNTVGCLSKPVAETSLVKEDVSQRSKIATQGAKIASTTTTDEAASTLVTTTPILKSRSDDAMDSCSSEDSTDSSLTALNHLPSVSSSTTPAAALRTTPVTKRFNVPTPMQTIIGGTQSTQTPSQQPTINSSPPLSCSQNADLKEQLMEFESILQQHMKGQSQSNESEPAQPTPVIRTTAAAGNITGQTQQFVAKPSFGSELLALANATTSNISRVTTIASTPVQRVLTYVAQAGNVAAVAAAASSSGTATRIPHNIPLVVVTSYSQPIASPALSVTSQSSSSPCVTPAAQNSGPPSTGKTIASKTVKTQKTKTVKTSTATSSKATPVAKPQQKPQEDEETVQRIYAILGEYAEKLRNSPDLNNKPAPRRRSNPPTNATQSSKRKKSCPTKTKLLGQGTDMSPSGDDMPPGSEDSSSGIAPPASSDRNSPVPQSGEELDDPPSTEPDKAENTESSSSEVSAAAGPSTSMPVNVTVASSNSTVVTGKPLVVGSTTSLPCVLPSNVRQVFLGHVGGVPRHQMMMKGSKLIRVVSANAPTMLTALPVHGVKALQGNPNATALVLQQLYNLNKLPGNAQLMSPNTVRQVKLPMAAISSQTLSGVTAQPPVVLPHTMTNSFSGLAQTLNFADVGSQSSEVDVKPHTSLLIPATSVMQQTSATETTSQCVKSRDQTVFKDNRHQHGLLAVTNLSLQNLEKFLNHPDSKFEIKKEIKIENEDSSKNDVSTQSDQEGEESHKSKKSPTLEQLEGDAGGAFFKIDHAMERPSNKVGGSSLVHLGASSQERLVYGQASGLLNQPSLSSTITAGSASSGRLVFAQETVTAVEAVLRERALQPLRSNASMIVSGVDGDTMTMKQERITPPPTSSSSDVKVKIESPESSEANMKTTTSTIVHTGTASNGDPKTRKCESDYPGITRLCDLQHLVELAHNGETRNQAAMKPTTSFRAEIQPPNNHPESDISQIQTSKQAATVAKVQFVQKIAQPTSTSQASAHSKVFMQAKPLSLSSPLTYSNAKRTYQISGDYHIKTAKSKQELENASLEHKIKQEQKEKELRLQKSLSEECEDLGVDAPRPSDLFPDTLLLETLPFDSSAADASCSQNVDSNDPFPCSDVRSADSTSDSMEGLQSSSIASGNPPRHLGNMEQLRYGKSSKSCLRYSGTMKKYSNAKTNALRGCSPSADINGSKTLPCSSNESPFSTSSGDDSFNAGPSNSLSSPIGEPFEPSESTTKSQDSLLSVVQHRGSHQTYGKRSVKSKESKKSNQSSKSQELESLPSRPFASVSDTFKRGPKNSTDLIECEGKDKHTNDTGDSSMPELLLLSEKGDGGDTKGSSENEEEEDKPCLRGHKRKSDENRQCKRKRRLTRCTRSLSGETTNDDDTEDEYHKTGGGGGGCSSSDSNWSASSCKSPALSESSPLSSEMKSGGECELTRRSSRRGSVKKNCPCCNGSPDRNQKSFKKGSNGKSISKGGQSPLKKR